jgi:hypothetical protein
MSFGKPNKTRLTAKASDLQTPAAATPAEPNSDNGRKIRELDKLRRGLSGNNAGNMMRGGIDRIKKTLLGG